MAQTIKQGNIFGRIGSGIGQGLAEQIPKEIERSRLASGLKELGEQKDQTPFQQFSALASIPGITPQMIQSGSDLLRQQAKGQALASMGQQQQPAAPKFPKAPASAKPNEGASQVPSITKGSLLEELQEGFTPRSEDEKFQAAGQKFNENPAFYGNDPQKAIDYENQVDETEGKKFQLKEAQYNRLSDIQKNVTKELQGQYERLKGDIPATLYSRIEDDAIQATSPRSEGGRGLSEQQAKKEFGEKMDEASKDFAKIKEITGWRGWGIAGRPADDTLRSLKGIQKKMEDADQTEEYAQTLIADGQLTPNFSYSIAQPVNKVPALNSFLKNLPEGNRQETLAETVFDIPATVKIAPSLASIVKQDKKASPLAVAYELQKKGYDSGTFLQYLVDHADELNLTTRQARQAATAQNIQTPWNDWWLSSFSGIE